MSNRGSKTAADKRHATRMRVTGYQDGLRGKPAMVADPDYLSSHRRGTQRAAEIARRSA